MRPRKDVEQVAALAAQGLSRKEIWRRTGINRSTQRYWERIGYQAHLARTTPCVPGQRCSKIDALPIAKYSYLLGQYLGDGHIVVCPRRVYKLRIFSDAKYQEIIREISDAMFAVLPNKVGAVFKHGCMEIYSHSKHWCCLFPQHGPGRKHDRQIALEDWQRAIVLQHPREFVRGLIHSDGCRSLNPVNGCEYPRYLFSNRSDDIKALFRWGCSLVGVSPNRMNAMALSVARRREVAILDSFIGPKK